MVTIADDVWIGAGARLLSGVTIETRCIIAAGAVVTRAVPSGSLYGGVPARKIRDLPRSVEIETSRFK
ncbi:DapH/DapD/GlmU-related protein [Sphingopyxis sp. DBS4]|uniref:acyltransferase n=1 Tax=Sphingopyxis sp. DBS4 TaxID=2968500 RepID=UPI0035A6BB41